MTITTLSSRGRNQDIDRAKRAAKDGPVIITDRGKPAHVLLSFEESERPTRPHRNQAEALYMPGMEDIQINFERPKHCCAAGWKSAWCRAGVRRADTACARGRCTAVRPPARAGPAP